MSKISISTKHAAVVATLAGALIAAAIGMGLRATGPSPAAAAMPHHAMMGDGARPSQAQPVVAAANTVVIDNFSFGPVQLKVAAGTKVVWTNDDADPHTVTSEADPKVLKSPPLDTGESFAFTFDKPGTYRYFCTIHPHMQGMIVVE